MHRLAARLTTTLAVLPAEDDGATAVEYGLMVALIAVAIIVAVTAVGAAISGAFTTVSTSV